jgi:hypothetical protein
MKLFSFLFFLLCPVLLIAQDEEYLWKEASPESQAYHAYRSKTTIPPYGLAKVKALIAKVQSGEDDNLVLNSKDYLALSLREKFTYNMIHAESYNQNCDAYPPIQDEQKKIFADLPDAFDEYAWSSRQRDFLNGNRDSVMALIRESVNRSGRMGTNYKMTLVEIDALEMIPFLVETYKRPGQFKDLDILTVLLQLMKKGGYLPFKDSQSYRKLYGPDSNHQSFLQYNKPNEDLIIERAMNLYKSEH